MAINATSSGGGKKFPPMESGMYVARCVQMIQIGTITEIINGESKTHHKVRIGFEFPTELEVFNEDKGEQPYSLSKDYTLSMHEKATLRNHLETWRGKKFTEDEAKLFDITKLIGAPCTINVIHKVSNNGQTYAEIGSISPLMKGTICPAQINETQILSYDDFDYDLYESLPSFIKDKIKTSVEFKALPGKQASQSIPTQEEDEEQPPF